MELHLTRRGNAVANLLVVLLLVLGMVALLAAYVYGETQRCNYLAEIHSYRFAMECPA